MSGTPALLIIMVGVAMGIWWIVRFRDAIGYAVGGILLVTMYSVATTGGPPDFGEHKPLAMVVVLGGLLLLFALDATARAAAMGKAAHRAGSPTGAAAAGCAWIAVMVFVGIMAVMVWAAAGGGA